MSSRPPAATRIIDSHTAGEPTRVVVSGGPDLGDGDMAQRRDRFRDGARCMAPGDRQRAARLGRARGSAAVRAGRRRERVRRDLLQQRRLHRHVRPRHDRRGRDARAPRPDRAGRSPDRNAGRRRDGDAARRRHRHRGQRAVVSSRDARRRGRSRSRRRAWRRRLGRQLVLPLRRPWPAARIRPRRRADGVRDACARGAARTKASPGPPAPRSITSSSSGRPRIRATTPATSCCVRAAPTTARPAAPARAPSSPASPPTASWRRAPPGARRA